MTSTAALAADDLPLHEDGDGVIRVGGTRVTLDVVVGAFDDGATAEEIAQQYPAIGLGDVYAVIAYAIRHRDEVEAYLLRRRGTAARVRAENEHRANPATIRERLLARHPARRP